MDKNHPPPLDPRLSHDAIMVICHRVLRSLNCTKCQRVRRNARWRVADLGQLTELAADTGYRMEFQVQRLDERLTERASAMDIVEFMDRYKVAWETNDEHELTAQFSPDGVQHNTPFAAQLGHAAIAAYWQRAKLKSDIRLAYEILARNPRGGVAH